MTYWKKIHFALVNELMKKIRCSGNFDNEFKKEHIAFEAIVNLSFAISR